MKMRHDIIIIGAGMAGIGCAHRLAKAKRNFLVISEDVGGRLMTSADGRINYGACFVLESYRHVLPYVTLGERLSPFHFELHGVRKHPYYLIGMARYPLQAARTLRLLIRFKKKYEDFQKQCESRSQKEVFESDQELMALYSSTAIEYARTHGIENVAREYMAQGVYACTFLPLSKVSAFDFLRLGLALVTRSYEFVFDKEKALRPIRAILKDRVVSIKKKRDEYEVTTEKGKIFFCTHGVIATQPQEARKLVPIAGIKKGSNAFLFHVRGRLKKKWSAGQFEFFNPASKTIFFRTQADGTTIVYARDPKPKLEDFFDEPEIIFRKYWRPAFAIQGDTLTENDRGDNLFLAGDYNTIGLEDSYITGIYAANRILSAVRKR